jgi:ABC-type nitrate/sulfonate/bicarbonate transport system substrate-binding protein
MLTIAKNISTVFLITMVFITCGQAKKIKKGKVTIGIQSSLISTPIIVAKAKNFFNDEGVDVTIKKFPSGKLAVESMLNNEVDLSTSADIPIMINSFSRNDFSVLLTFAYTDNGAWIIARKDRGIKEPSDLEGRTIATQKLSAVHFFLSLFLLHNQIPESKVKIKYMKAVELPGALIKGTIDAFSMRNPFITNARKALGQNAIEFFMPEIYRQRFNLVVMKNYIKKNPEIINSIIRALLKTRDFILRQEKDAKKIAAEELGIINDSVLGNDWKNYYFRISLDQAFLKTLEDQARWAIGKKLTEKKAIPDFYQFIYQKPLMVINPDLVSIIK